MAEFEKNLASLLIRVAGQLVIPVVTIIKQVNLRLTSTLFPCHAAYISLAHNRYEHVARKKLKKLKKLPQLWEIEVLRSRNNR